MTFNVLEDISIETPEGIKTLKSGQVIRLSKDEAMPLIGAGIITPIGKVAYRVYSEILEAFLWVTDTDEDMKALRASGKAGEPIYSAYEVKKLKGIDKDSLRAIHKVKEVFEKSKIKETKDRSKNE